MRFWLLEGGGTSPRFHLEVLKDQVINYSPDLVIEIFFPDNDVYDEHPEHADGSEWLEVTHGKREFWRPSVLYFYLEASLLEKGYTSFHFWVKTFAPLYTDSEP